MKWDEGASNEEKLERIITQKWIEIFPLGNEAWAEYRRTGYPKLMPAKDNKSGTLSLPMEVELRQAFTKRFTSSLA